jgi:hypothetical protein
MKKILFLILILGSVLFGLENESTLSKMSFSFLEDSYDHFFSYPHLLKTEGKLTTILYPSDLPGLITSGVHLITQNKTKDYIARNMTILSLSPVSVAFMAHNGYAYTMDGWPNSSYISETTDNNYDGTPGNSADDEDIITALSNTAISEYEELNLGAAASVSLGSIKLGLMYLFQKNNGDADNMNSINPDRDVITKKLSGSGQNTYLYDSTGDEMSFSPSTTHQGTVSAGIGNIEVSAYVSIIKQEDITIDSNRSVTDYYNTNNKLDKILTFGDGDESHIHDTANYLQIGINPRYLMEISDMWDLELRGSFSTRLGSSITNYREDFMQTIIYVPATNDAFQITYDHYDNTVTELTGSEAYYSYSLGGFNTFSLPKKTFGIKSVSVGLNYWGSISIEELSGKETSTVIDIEQNDEVSNYEGYAGGPIGASGIMTSTRETTHDALNTRRVMHIIQVPFVINFAMKEAVNLFLGVNFRLSSMTITTTYKNTQGLTATDIDLEDPALSDPSVTYSGSKVTTDWERTVNRFNTFTELNLGGSITLTEKLKLNALAGITMQNGAFNNYEFELSSYILF